MKQRIRERDGHTPAEAKCVYCGLKASTCEALKKLSLDNITIPEFTKLPIASKSEVFYCCSDCKQAILDDIWDNVLNRSPKKNKLGLFFDLNEYVSQFVVKNQKQLVEIAHDYQIILSINEEINKILNLSAIETGDNHSKIDPVLPSKVKVIGMFREPNNNPLSEYRCSIEYKGSCSCHDDEDIFDELCERFEINEDKRAWLEESGVHAAIEIHVLEVRPELYYNKDVVLNVSFFCVDVAKYLDILEQYNKSRQTTHTSSIKPPKNKSSKISGGDVDFGTEFKID